MNPIDSMNRYDQAPQNAPKQKINLMRQCEVCMAQVPMNSGLFFYLPQYTEYANWQQDRVGKRVCISCLPPQIQKQLTEKTVNASKNDYIDNLFSEIFKAD
jgi:hypothetical protein